MAVAEAELLVSSVSRWSRFVRLMVLVCWPTVLPVTRMVRVTVCPTAMEATVQRPVSGSNVPSPVEATKVTPSSRTSTKTTLVAVVGGWPGTGLLVAVMVNTTS